jgi:hypothetical protein
MRVGLARHANTIPRPGRKEISTETNGPHAQPAQPAHPPLGWTIALAVYRPEKAKDTGAAVVICPGGGYNILAMDLEGIRDVILPDDMKDLRNKVTDAKAFDHGMPPNSTPPPAMFIPAMLPWHCDGPQIP